jgi:hypothetical protein
MTPPGQDTADVRASTALEDPGTAKAFLILGWIPPAVAAVVGGVIVAVATGNVLVLLGVALGGTLVGYVVGLVALFTVGWFLSPRVGKRVANVFLVLVVAVSVAASLAVAVAASGVEFDPVLVDSVERATTTVLGLTVIVIMIVGVFLMRRPRA